MLRKPVHACILSHADPLIPCYNIRYLLQDQIPVTIPDICHNTRYLSQHQIPFATPDTFRNTRYLSQHQLPFATPDTCYDTRYLLRHQTPGTDTMLVCMLMSLRRPACHKCKAFIAVCSSNPRLCYLYPVFSLPCTLLLALHHICTKLQCDRAICEQGYPVECKTQDGT